MKNVQVERLHLTASFSFPIDDKSMAISVDQQNSEDIKPSNLVSHDSRTVQPNNATETPIPDSVQFQRQVQNLIERCLQLYMNKDEVVKTLLNRARIDFFSAVNNLPMGYPIMQQPPIHAIGQPHVGPVGYSTSGCHVVNGVPAPGNFLQMRTNSGNKDQGCCTRSGLNPPGVDCEVPLLSTAINTNTADLSPVMPPNNAVSSISDMPVSPTSVASSGHFPFSASEISGMGVESSVLDSAFTSEAASSVGLQLPPDNGAGNSRDSLGSWAQIPWDFSLSYLTPDLSNLGDLGALENYPTSPFLPSDSDILLDSPEQEDIVEEFFVDSDSVPGQCPPPDEEKS
ncbi:UNVERIFIED_CONTAM: hypothetical protein Scaly_2656500 [Sesamum calycinum]|uniref:Uncharacterized protein n=1 Tax=Sesamum calycinum TaxID=2727403 RepID=A0AAW2J9K8_9LAMI